MFGGVQLYKEPLLLPMENLPGALGDTRKLSVSSGLEGSRGQAVIDGRRPLDHRRDQGTRDRGLGGQAQWRDPRSPFRSLLETSQIPTAPRVLSQMGRGTDRPL